MGARRNFCKGGGGSNSKKIKAYTRKKRKGPSRRRKGSHKENGLKMEKN